MTVFLADTRYTTRMTEIRTEVFGDDFPASAAITVTGFADPNMLIEIQGLPPWHHDRARSSTQST
jgi:2-iminobutanoate/2-iminopropanoate deaminase